MIRWRAPIAIEGRVTADNRVLAPGLINWAGRLPVPLVTIEPEPGEGVKVIGSVATVERRGEMITATGTLEYIPETLGVAVMLIDVSAHEGDGYEVVFDHGTLSHVALSENPAWPECIIEILDD